MRIGQTLNETPERALAAALKTRTLTTAAREHCHKVGSCVTRAPFDGLTATKDHKIDFQETRISRFDNLSAENCRLPGPSPQQVGPAEGRPRPLPCRLPFS